MKKYRSDYVHKIIEEDNYANGCTGSAMDRSYSYTIEGDTVQELQAQIIEHTGAISAEVFDGDGKSDRIDAQTLENEDGYSASPKQIEQWKNNEIALFLCDYSFYFTAQTPANFMA
jgi:hypothetical protein